MLRALPPTWALDPSWGLPVSPELFRPASAYNSGGTSYRESSGASQQHWSNDLFRFRRGDGEPGCALLRPWKFNLQGGYHAVGLRVSRARDNAT